MSIARLIAASGLILAAGAVACDDDDPTSPELPSAFTANLTGGAERPAVVTTASGTATFTVNATRTGINYSIRIRDFPNNVTACHIHSGASDATSNVLVTLCEAGVTGPFTGLTEIASGTIVKGDNHTAKGISPIKLETLIAMMAAGDVYVNVHSNAFPQGEIRGTPSVTP